MTYLMLYTPDEKSNRTGLPVFESWSGSLNREELALAGLRRIGMEYLNDGVSQRGLTDIVLPSML
jgi:hypothetical protein